MSAYMRTVSWCPLGACWSSLRPRCSAGFAEKGRRPGFAERGRIACGVLGADSRIIHRCEGPVICSPPEVETAHAKPSPPPLWDGLLSTAPALLNELIESSAAICVESRFTRRETRGMLRPSVEGESGSPSGDGGGRRARCCCFPADSSPGLSKGGVLGACMRSMDRRDGPCTTSPPAVDIAHSDGPCTETGVSGRRCRRDMAPKGAPKGASRDAPTDVRASE
mmetsp:Transcript_12956/g.32882  ORF Transcript_12956/g.32882 Transcript_12956/m.32882 type:complete len:223 (+) Transcript_12956:432-1100(+)